VKDFSSEIGGTLKNLGSQLLAGFQADGHCSVVGLRASRALPPKFTQHEL